MYIFINVIKFNAKVWIIIFLFQKHGIKEW